MTRFVYDGTWDGLLSAIFAAFRHEGAVIEDVRTAQPAMFDSRVVETDTQSVRRLTKGMNRLGPETAAVAYRGFLAERADYGGDLLLSLRLGFGLGADPFTQRQHPFVHRVCAASERVACEAHRMMGLVRFTLVCGDLFMGDITPDCNILPLLGPHFHDRFNTQRMILRDLRRKTAVVSQPGGWWLTELPPGELPPLPDDRDYAGMWRSYFKAIAQTERVNPRLQQKFVPLKYRRFLTEFQTEDMSRFD